MAGEKLIFINRYRRISTLMKLFINVRIPFHKEQCQENGFNESFLIYQLLTNLNNGIQLVIHFHHQKKITRTKRKKDKKRRSKSLSRVTTFFVGLDLNPVRPKTDT